MAPATFLAEAAGGTCEVTDDGASVRISLPDGRSVQAARGIIAVAMENRLRVLDCEAVERDGVLCLPVAWFFRTVCGRNVSEYGGVLYASECYGDLSMHMARLLKDLLK